MNQTREIEVFALFKMKEKKKKRFTECTLKVPELESFIILQQTNRTLKRI